MLGENFVFCLQSRTSSFILIFFYINYTMSEGVEKLLMTDGENVEVMGHHHPTCSTSHLDGNSLDLLLGLNVTLYQEN